VSSTAQAWVLAVHGVISVALIGAATFLAYSGSLDPQSVATIFGAAIGLVGGSAGSLAVLSVTGNGKNGNAGG